MALYTLVTIVTLVLAYFVIPREQVTVYGTTRRQALSRVCLVAIFTILFLLSSLRMEVGNDYKNYAITCHEIWVNGYVVTEPGFNFLVKLIYTILGGEDYIAVFAIFSLSTVALFLFTFRKDSESFFWSVVLFMSLGVYFRTFNTVRYYFVLVVALCTVSLVAKKKYPAFVLIIIAAAFFHKSVLFVIPVYIFANYMKKKWHYVVLLMGGIMVFIGRDLVMWLALKLYPSYENTSYISATDSILSNLPAIGRCGLVLLLCLIYYKQGIENHSLNRICFNLNIMAIVLVICGYYIPLIDRFSHYLMIPHLLLVPNLIAHIENRKSKKVVIGMATLFCFLYFVVFLKTADEPGVRVLPYKTWIMEGLQEYNYYNEFT